MAGTDSVGRTTAKPQIRRASPVLRVKGTVWDWRAGEKFQRITTVEIVAEEWLNQRTGRYSRRYSAREAGALGWHLCGTPRQAILRATNPVVRRGGWVAEAVRKAEALEYR